MGSGINTTGIEPSLEGITDKFAYQQRLMTQVVWVGIIASAVHILLDWYKGEWFGVGIDLFLLGNFSIIYAIHKKGHYVASRFYLVLFANLAFYFIATIIPKWHGVFLLLLPMVCLPFILFEYERRFLRWGLSLLPVLLGCVLELTGYYSVIKIQVEQGQTYSFVLNFLTAAFVLFFIIDFLFRAHNRAESDLEHNQIRLKGLSDDLRRKNRELEKANKELDRFVYSASHDLKAPLASVKGLINLARHDDPTAMPSYFNMMEERVDHLEKFIKEITTYSRNSRMEVSQEPVSLPCLAEDVVKGLRFMPRAEDIALEVVDDIKGEVMVDKYRLTIIMNNLISNAVKYHDLKHEKPVIRLWFAYEEGILKIAVEDNGPGIEEDQLSRIFEMFYRGSENSDGTGLGLYIAKEVAEKLDGSLSVQSEPGKGTVFTFRMPIAEPDRALAPVACAG